MSPRTLRPPSTPIWFFQASACGVQAVPAYTLIADGAALLARSVDYDWSLLRLNGAPPRGVTFAAWNAAGPLTGGTAVAVIHHPEGDLKKISQGNVFGYRPYSDGSSFIQAQWTLGATEEGSSGAGLFALNSVNGNYELRGSLAGGSGTCSTPRVPDEFSRFDVAFPLVQEYLAPDATNSGKTTPVTEFYKADSGTYLLTADPPEVRALDDGAPDGWVRTGLRFLAYTDPAAAPMAVQPVCRLRLAPGHGDDRLYTASPQECADIRQITAAHGCSRLPPRFTLRCLMPQRARARRTPDPSIVSRARPTRRGGGTRRRSTCATR